MIRIGIDGRSLQGNHTGIGRYICELCRRLDQEFPEAVFYVYTNKNLKLPCTNERWILRYDTSIWGKLLKPVLWTKFRAGFLCKQDNLSVFWGTTTFLPILQKNIRTVVTIHDFNCILFPQTMKTTHLWAHKLFFMRDIKNADYRIANSHGTAQRVKKYCNVSVDTVISASVDKRFKTQSKEEISETISKINVKQPYLLSLGTLEPRKNLKVTINAYLELKKKGLLSEYSLIIAGGRGWKDTSIVAMTQIDPSIIHLGYVEDKFIPGLYGGAAMFVYPTLYEGYGLPVLEALKCGTKVVTTNIPEITEVGGNDRVVYVEPTREGVMGGILSIKDRVLKEFPNLPEHTWEDDGKALAKLFRSIV